MTAAKMNPEIKARWLAALRSGEYIQGKGFLRQDFEDHSTYCCLGVLCEMAVADGVVSLMEGTTGEGRFYGHSYLDAFNVILPLDVSVWAGLPNPGGDIERRIGEPCPNGGIEGAKCDDTLCSHCYFISLTELNDEPDPGYNFHQIAEVIEKWL